MVNIVGKFLLKTFLEIIVLCLLVFNTVITKSYDTTIVLVIMTIFLLLNHFVFQTKKVKSSKVGDVVYIVAGITIIYHGLFYLLGFKTGFTNNYNSMFKNYIEASTWIKVFLIVILTEIFRYQSISEEKKKIRKVIHELLTMAILVFLDVSICTKVYNLGIFSQLYEFLALTVVQSIAKNIFLNHIVMKFGITPCITYRVIMDLYIYFLPTTPSINVYIEGIALLLFPYMLNNVIDGVTERKGLVPSKKRKKESKLLNALSYVLFGILVILVSREFEYAMIAIGSGSMTGSINKGDAIIYKRYDETKDLEAGDIIVFNKDNMIVIHRIVKRYTIYGEEVYQTKGDANESADNWIVKQEDIVGTVEMRIPLIAWPSVLVNSSY